MTAALDPVGRALSAGLSREGRLRCRGRVACTLSRIAHEIIEGNPEPDRVALIGIQTRGVPLASACGG